MNTSLVLKTREHLADIRTDLEYTDVFPKGMLSAGTEILSNPDMTAVAKRSIFQLGLYQNIDTFILNDLYGELLMLDMRYKVDSGDLSDIEAGLTLEQLQELKTTLNDLRDNTFDYSLIRDELLVGSLRLIYETAKRAINREMHADSMFAICKLALKLGYRIIMEDNDLTSFGGGVFRDMFQAETPEYFKTTAIVSCGLSFKVILNDAQNTFPQGDPISNRIKQVFPEAQNVSIKVSRRVLNNE